MTPPHAVDSSLLSVVDGLSDVEDALLLEHDDLQLSMLMLLELHHRGLRAVDDGWEWEPSLLAVRQQLERHHERGLRHLIPVPRPVSASEVPRALRALVAADKGPQLSSFLARRGTVSHYRDFVMRRSIYHLGEGDPHTWAIPRLSGRAKAALVEIQADEYGGGRPDRMHSEMFATTMRGLSLDPTYGRYVDDVPAIVMATVTTMSWFGLHRRHLGAIVGHLAAFEMTSSVPNRRYADGLRRLGLGPEVTAFYDEHVEADAVHEQIAVHDLCGALSEQEPDTTSDILWGAACALALDNAAAEDLFRAWHVDASALAVAVSA